MKRISCFLYVCLLLICLYLLTGCQNNNAYNVESYLQEGAVINNKKVPYYGFNDPVELYVAGTNNDVKKVEQYESQVKSVDYGEGFAVRDYNGGVEIVQGGFEEEVLEIPETLDGKPVIKLGGYFEDPEPILNEESRYSFYSCFWNTECKVIYIPSSVKEIVKGTFDIETLEKIEVDKDNPYYSSKDGILYNKDGTIKLCVPNHHRKSKQ